MDQNKLAYRILSYLEAHLEENPTLDVLAERLHYSKFYLNRVFQQATGQSIGTYVRSRRLTEAARRLVETECPIVEIAMDAGYHSQQSFTGAFRQLYGCSPQVYRNQRRFSPACPPLTERSSWNMGRPEGRAA